MNAPKDRGPGVEALRKLETRELQEAISLYKAAIERLGVIPAGCPLGALERLADAGQAEIARRRRRAKRLEAAGWPDIAMAVREFGVDAALVETEEAEKGKNAEGVFTDPLEILKEEDLQTGPPTAAEAQGLIIPPDTTDAAASVEKAMRGKLDDLAVLQRIAAEHDDGATLSATKAAELEALGFSREGDPLDEQAAQLLAEYPLCVETTTTFEIILDLGGPDELLLIECDVYEDAHIGGSGAYSPVTYEIRRVLYRYSWEGSAEVELTGEDRETAEGFARRVVPELAE